MSFGAGANAFKRMCRDVLVAIVGTLVVLAGVLLIAYGVNIHPAMWIIGIFVLLGGIAIIGYFIYQVLKYWFVLI